MHVLSCTFAAKNCKKKVNPSLSVFLKVACCEEILTNDITIFADLTLSDRNIHHLIEIELIFHKNFLGTWDSLYKRVNNSTFTSMSSSWLKWKAFSFECKTKMYMDMDLGLTIRSFVWRRKRNTILLKLICWSFFYTWSPQSSSMFCS